MNIYVLYGSETGNAQGLAQDAEKFFTLKGHSVTLKELDAVSVSDLKSVEGVIIVTSTWGDGDAPSNASNFVKELKAYSGDLSDVSYAVFAIGSSSFPQFCQSGIDIDTKLTELGAKRMVEISMADDDYTQFPSWLETVI